MGADITDMLREWEFDPDNQIRIVQAEDGRQVLQVRQPMGIEQYELDGRPDGTKPFGKESVLEEYQARLENYKQSHGSETGFAITHDDFAPLQGEGLLYYFRYLVLFQIGDFVRSSRDTDHNLALCALVEKFAESDEDRKNLLQYKPYILRMNAISRAMISLHKEMKGAAVEILKAAIAAIEGMGEIDTPAFQFERVRSVNYLKATLKQIREKKASPTDGLQSQLKEAVDEEDYERAAVLRDRIRELGVEESPEEFELPEETEDAAE